MRGRERKGGDWKHGISANQSVHYRGRFRNARQSKQVSSIEFGALRIFSQHYFQYYTAVRSRNPMAQPKLKILIVDDDKAFLTMITALLLSIDKNLSIDNARSGEECLRKVKKLSPNLVFLDIDMKGMNGLVTLRFIKSIDSSALVFFLSGHSVEYIKDALAMVPADGYFTKTYFVDLLKTQQPLDEILREGKTDR